MRKFYVESYDNKHYLNFGYKKVSDIRTTLTEIVNFHISETYCSHIFESSFITKVRITYSEFAD